MVSLGRARSVLRSRRAGDGPKNALPCDGYDFDQAWRTALPEDLYPTSFVADATIKTLTEFACGGVEKPFFIHCSFPDPHHPFTPPGKYWDLYDPAECPPPASASADLIDAPPMANRIRAETTRESRLRYPVAAYAAIDEREIRETLALTYGMITIVNDAVGRVLAALEELGLDRDTIVIFNSDHGDFMLDHGLMSKHCFHNQGLIRVPFIWAEPGESHPKKNRNAFGNPRCRPNDSGSRRLETVTWYTGT